MKTNTLLLLGLSTLVLCIPEARSMNLETTPIYCNKGDNVPTGYEEIVLMGDLMLGTGPNPIIAGANQSSVYLHFNHNFGDMSISIYNAAGNLVYSTVVNTAVQETVVIPILGTASGTYTVSLSNANGYAEGSFNRTYSM